jgi:hypothetical protein
MFIRCTTASLVLAAFAAPATASHYLVMLPDEASRSYTLPPPFNSARLAVTKGSLSIWVNEVPLQLDDAWLRSFKGAGFDSAVLARDPTSSDELFVLIDCFSGRLVLTIGNDRQVQYRDEQCHDA